MAAAAGAAAATGKSAAAQSAQPSTGATPVPSATPTPAPSAAARAMAARVGRFDSSLTQKQLDDIAAGIEQIYGFGDTLHPKGAALKNGDAPLPAFEVPL